MTNLPRNKRETGSPTETSNLIVLGFGGKMLGSGVFGTLSLVQPIGHGPQA